MTRVVVIEDHPLVRGSLVELLRDEGGYDIVGEAGTVRDAHLLLQRVRPDLLLLDLSLTDGSGLEVLDQLRGPDRPLILLFTMHGDAGHVSAAAAAGIDGYVTKDASPDELLRAVATILSGDSYVSGDAAHHLLAARRSSHEIDLTEREREILTCLARGRRVADIASELHIASKTVKNHLTAVYAKLGVETGAQAVAEAYRRGLVQPGDAGTRG
jgi:DNA-binding NarL/FixJ family response regulator